MSPSKGCREDYIRQYVKCLTQWLALSKYSRRSIIVNTDEEITCRRQRTCWRPHVQEVPLPGNECGSLYTKAKPVLLSGLWCFGLRYSQPSRVSTPRLFHFQMLLGPLFLHPFRSPLLMTETELRNGPRTTISCFQWFRNNGDPVCAGVGLRIGLIQRSHEIG